jgi:hypothetical protein
MAFHARPDVPERISTEDLLGAPGGRQVLEPGPDAAVPGAQAVGGGIYGARADLIGLGVAYTFSK